MNTNLKVKYFLMTVVFLLNSFIFANTTDDLVFIHHSCGNNWLNNSLHSALLAKDYINERNDIYYGTTMSPDAGRPTSFGDTPGDNTNMNHWILWFNDYPQGIKAHDCADGENKIIMFKSCYPISNISSDGSEPGDPFSSNQTLANYKAVFRHPDGTGNTYTHNSYTYSPLEDIFANNPNTLFIPVTAPPRHYAPDDATNDAEAQRARDFNNWLKNDWLNSYNTAFPNLKNVAVFDWFDVLAYSADHATHPNRLKEEYGGTNGDSHPNATANNASTVIFASGENNFLDQKWNDFLNAALPVSLSSFTANYTDGVVELRWTTLSENRNLGWNIYRAKTVEFAQVVKINEKLINGAGTSAEKKNYFFRDDSEFIDNQTYWYWLQCIDFDGNTETFKPVSLTITITTVTTKNAVPADFVLYPNYPNPFNRETIIQYYISSQAKVKIEIFDSRGVIQKTLINKIHEAGIYKIHWSAKGNSSGIFLCRLTVNNRIDVKKLIYIK